MIYVKIKGRLGNQLFYYAFARKLQKNSNYGKIVIIPEDAEYDKFGGIGLLDFKVSNVEIGDKIILDFDQKCVYYAYQVLKKIIKKLNYKYLINFICKSQHFLNYMGIYNMEGYEICKIYNTRRKNIMISGAWEIPKYFDDIKETIQSEIQPNKEILPHNIELASIIQESNAICLSIRKGDFLSKGNEKFNICSDEYYYSGIKLICSKIPDAKIVVFSDDINWCKNNLRLDGYDVLYENNDGNDPVWEKLRLMSMCKYFVIANSTFSWWAQYLCEYTNKIVVAPRPWRNNEYCDCLYDSSFILLDPRTGKIQ